jgi:hypothetical protein
MPRSVQSKARNGKYTTRKGKRFHRRGRIDNTANEHRQTMNGSKATKVPADANRVSLLDLRHGKQHQFLPHGRGTPIGKILVPIDFSPQPKLALKYAAIFMRQFGSPLTLLHTKTP